MRLTSKTYLGKKMTYDLLESKPNNNFITGSGVVLHNCEAMYNAVMNRMVSRFMVAGKVPGFIVMISSRRSRDSFMERKIKEAITRQGDPNLQIFYKVHSLWQAKPEKFFPSKKYFYIDTDTFEKIKPGFGEELFDLQLSLLERKKRLGLLESEDIGLIT